MTKCTYNDCLSAPIKPECFDPCVFEILSRSKLEQRLEILKISRRTAELIFFIFHDLHPKNYYQLAKHLNDNQNQEIIKVFKNITQEQLNHFR